MLNNDFMIKGRFLRWHRARQLFGAIAEHIQSGGVVQVCTYTHARLYRSVDQFRCTKTGVLAQRGKHWDDIMGCRIQYGRYRSK